mmetsp:Transcript_114190/g.170808  ORF Transcript_114190/g.170808 Transcript_114190/m.170808 type:complete len:118 (-) Transcript_114190:629-982(-)
MEKELRFKLPLYISFFADWFFTVWYLNYITTHDLTLFKLLGFSIVAGHFAASNINIAHELMHKVENKLDTTLGMLALSKNMYMHFYIEHLYGHHKNIATPKDPATSKFNQSFYKYLP